MSNQEAIDLLNKNIQATVIDGLAMSEEDEKHEREWLEIQKMAVVALEKQIPKKVYHFLEDDTFETTCCGIDVTNKDYKYCPECGCLLGEVEEVEYRDE